MPMAAEPPLAEMTHDEQLQATATIRIASRQVHLRRPEPQANRPAPQARSKR